MSNLGTHFDPETRERLEALAKTMDKSVPWLVADAVRRYVMDEGRVVGAIAVGLRQADAGLFTMADVVRESFSRCGVDTAQAWTTEAWSDLQKLGSRLTAENSRGLFQLVAETLEMLRAALGKSEEGRVPGTREVVMADPFCTLIYRVRGGEVQVLRIIPQRD
ncbi:type II toxin-antitoxin system RelE/ParE family toxin [Nitratidesulfovibrio liaohensis]|uniref:Type II toxin-antitoxin system RelE/ParE family toxin n=1 Tax=Nitratidesulfovibrio liaohensis TaxID=2604158 RepID=A0ABY9QZA9_9BACT|nr:type II toxin-antitoxin system RelE/ParE family toxin [Nitratidesulfovibrio liaohensis]WMW64682.1 type II toxin-antitoxin system RelE/ParE family toxin [Nitratidesulfovibrio liaohensis]